jgi:hypothetical protein
MHQCGHHIAVSLDREPDATRQQALETLNSLEWKVCQENLMLKSITEVLFPYVTHSWQEQMHHREIPIEERPWYW